MSEQKLTEAQEQAQAALEKVMNCRFSNFDAGAVIHWAERGMYQLKTAAPAEQMRVTGFRGNPLRAVLSNGDEATIGQKLIDNFATPSPFEQHPDDAAVDRFATAMKAKLAQKRDEGRSGWDDKDDCSQLFLSQLLREHVEKGDPLDVGNFAMMLHQREERIASLLETLQGE